MEKQKFFVIVFIVTITKKMLFGFQAKSIDLGDSKCKLFHKDFFIISKKK